MKAVIYAAKSTEDKHGSIPGQLADCRALANREDWDVVFEDNDEGFSAFKGNRGPGLARVKDALVEHAPCVLIVQHTDRLARGAGDEPGAADHLMELYFWLGRHRIELWSVQAGGKVDRIRALLEGERNTEDSARKSKATRDGLRRRKERGAPVGAMPLGYTVQTNVVDDKVITKRVVDPATAPTVERIFEMVEAGATFGDVARALNAEGVVGRRGKPWVSRTVRTIVHNAAYAGAKGYPALIEPERWQAILDGSKRLDPAAVQRRKGGRRPADDSYLLRGVAFCARCGAAFYTRRQAAGRPYVCANRRQGTGLCDAPSIPAALIEGHVLGHLDCFVGDVQQWLSEQLAQRTAEHQARETAVERERAALDDLDRTREQHIAEYRRQVAEGRSTAYLALEEVERL